MAMFLGSHQQKWVFRIAVLVACSLGGLGAWLFVANPQFAQNDDFAHTYERALNKEPAVLLEEQTARLTGLFLMLCGAGVAAMGAVVANPNPATLTPPGASSASNLVELNEEQVQQEVRELQLAIAQVLTQSGWLSKVMKCPNLVILGDPGSGKTSFASAIGAFRLLRYGWNVLVYDLHADANLKRGVWVCGRVFGATDKNPTAPEQQIKAGLAKAQQWRDEGDELTAIFDEFSGWEDEPVLQKIQAETVKSSHRDNRKSRNKHIFCLHWREKGGAGGKSLPTGLMNAFLKAAAVVELIPESDDEGETVFTGKARFKPANVPFTEGNFMDVAVPDLLNPHRIRMEIGHILDHLNLGIEIEAPTPVTVPASPNPQIVREVGQRLNPDNPSVASYLKRIADGPVTEDFLDSIPVTNKHPAEAQPARTPDWDKLMRDRINYARAVQLFDYLFNPRKKHGRRADGAYPVQQVWNNFGRSKGFAMAEQFHLFLDTLNNLHFGEFIPDTALHWRPLIKPDDLNRRS